MKLYSVQVGTEKFQITEAEHGSLQRLIHAKERGMFATESGSFLIERVNSIKPLNFVDYSQPEIKREYVSEAQRQKNIRRLHIAKLWLKRKQNPAMLIEPADQADLDKFAAWMDSDVKKNRMALKLAFKQEFYDVEFADNDELEYCFQSWLPFHDGSRDPRGYSRDDHTPEALGLREENSLLKKSIQLFGVGT